MPSPIHEEVQKSEKLLDDYQEHRQDWASQAVEDDEFRNNSQWTTKQQNVLKNRAQSPIVDNVIHPAVEQAKALLTANKPKFQSTGRDDSDTKVGRVFSDLMSYIWDCSNGNVEIKQAIDDYYVKGMGVLQSYVDPMMDFGRGEVCIKSIDPLDLYIDPSSRDTFCKDASNLIVARLFTEDQIKTMYPAVNKPLAEDSGTLLSQMTPTNNERYPGSSREGNESQRIGPVTDDVADVKTFEIIDRYEKIKLPFWHCLDTTNGQEVIHDEEGYSQFLQEPAMVVEAQGQTNFVTGKYEVQELMQVYQQTGGQFHMMMNQQTGQPEMMAGPEHEESMPGTETKLAPISYKELLDEGILICNNVLVDRIKRVLSVGRVLVAMHVMDIDTYPIVTIMNRHNRNPYPMSDVRFVKPIQEYINKITSLIIAHASSSTNTKLLIPRGSMNRKQLEEEWSRAGTGVIEFDPELGQPVVAGPVPLPNELYKNREDAKQSIYHILGIHPLQHGDPSSAPQTYKGTVAIDEYSQRRIKSKLDDIEASLNMIGRVVVKLIQQTYTDEKILRIMKPDGTEKETTINSPIYDDFTNEIVGKVNDVTIGNYDLIVVSGATLPSNRWARFDYYMSLYEKGIIDQQEVLEQTEVADTEGVLKRTSMLQQLQQQVEQQEEQIKELTGDLQTAQRESTSDRKRVEVEKFKTKLNKSANKTEQASSMFSMRLGDELDKVKEETREIETNQQNPVAVT
tara:strand:+ start:3931 stop:6138 length:2208 start_codon:yes stop_codon:yes gene_type:complete